MVDALARCGFYLPGRADLVVGGDPRERPAGPWAEEATWPDRLEGSEDAWITQTYLRLSGVGHPVRACDASTLDGLDVVVLHPGRIPSFLAARGRRRIAAVVTIADKTYGAPAADVLITQNDLQPGPRRVHVPHWPQPGLLPRDPTRSGVRTAAFKGREDSLHPGLRDPSWSSALADLGITWSLDDPAEGRHGTGPHPWSDHREVDVLVALRPPKRDQRRSKPATKLANAWLAGVPAILGAEPQYAALRRGPDDYLEVRTPADALDALRMLRDDPTRHAAMVANARRRAPEVDVDAVGRRWVAVLESIATGDGPNGARRAGRRLVQGAYRARVRVGSASVGSTPVAFGTAGSGVQ